MKLVQAKVKLTSITANAYKVIANAARVSHRSLPKQDEQEFIKSLIKRGHKTPFEQVHARFLLVQPRSVIDELVRYRCGLSIVVESTRYVDYAKGLEFIMPPLQTNERWNALWGGFVQAEKAYQEARAAGAAPQIARSLLPLNAVSRAAVCVNFSALRHILKERLAGSAHPEIRAMAAEMRGLVSKKYPAIFEDL